MSPELLTMALLHFAPHCARPQAARIAQAILPASKRRGLDPLLMVAVVAHETGGTCRHAVRHERVGGCSVGPFQAYHRDCREAQRLYADLRRAARRAAYILWLGKMRCRATVAVPWYCRRGIPYARYNPRSRRWAYAVQRLYKRLRAWSAARGGLS